MASVACTYRLHFLQQKFRIYLVFLQTLHFFNGTFLIPREVLGTAVDSILSDIRTFIKWSKRERKSTDLLLREEPRGC